MKKFLWLFVLMIFMTGCGGGEQKNSSDNNSKALKKIVIGIDDEYAPMGFRDDKGEIVGFDIDLAREVAKRMGVEVEFKPIDWNNKENEITSGNIDMIWNGFDITPERQSYVLYSKPYLDNRQILLVKSGNRQNISSEGDLAGKKIGTQTGSNSEDYINQNDALKNSFATFKTYRNFNEGFEALTKGELDVMIIDEIVGRYEMVRHPGTFEFIEVTIGPATEIGIGFRKDNTELRDKVQKVFDEMIADGTTKRISEQWFQADLVIRN